MEFFQFAADFGLVVLIWIVQLIIYPSFEYFERDKLIKWHKKYTRNISLVVMPLMLTQLGLYAYMTYVYSERVSLYSLTLIIINWLLTFAIFVPIHRKIANNRFIKPHLRALVSINWWRTFLWTIVFLINFLK